jgi:hypothetical protein
MQPQTQSKRAATIAKRNAAFEKLSPEKKRVQIAKDVLKALDTKAFLPRNGAFVIGADGALGAIPLIERDTPQDLQVCEAAAFDQCRVCALGGLFVTAVQRADKLTVRELRKLEGYERSYNLADPLVGLSDDSVVPYLERFFDKGQLFLIEAAFEGGRGWASAYDVDVFDLKEDDYFKAKAFCGDLKTPAGRMRRIMNNIIANNGTFVP